MVQTAPLQKAIEALGSARALAAVLRITPQALSQWREIPIGRVVAIEGATGIPRHELRPDIFQRPEVVARQHMRADARPARARAAR